MLSKNKEHALKPVRCFFLVVLFYLMWASTLSNLGCTIVSTTRRTGTLLGDSIRSLHIALTVPQGQRVGYQNKWVGFPGHSSTTDCHLAFRNNSVKNYLFHRTVERASPKTFLFKANENCTSFREHYGFLRYPKATKAERKFPLAFILLFHTDFDQVMFLLRAIYHPHNVYCLNVDSKVRREVLNATLAVSRCLPNVFVVSQLEWIIYAGYSRLQADVNCMGDLMKHPVKWRYVINSSGQQFPLRTNLEIVKILQRFNGRSDIEGITGNRTFPLRYLYKHIYSIDNKTGIPQTLRTSMVLEPPPHGFEVVKGSAYGTFSRDFVQFVLYDKRARDLLQWSRRVKSPDEYFWATLYHSRTIPAPGGYIGNPDVKPWLTSFAAWHHHPCATIRQHSVCILTPEDIPFVWSQPSLFANKFYITHHPAALHCLDEMIFNLTWQQTVRPFSFHKWPSDFWI